MDNAFYFRGKAFVIGNDHYDQMNLNLMLLITRLRKKQNLCPIDVKWFGVIHRYWSAFESRSIWSHGTFLIHLPGDKMFEAQVDLSAKTVNEIFTGYNWFRNKQRLKHIIKGVIARFIR